MKIPLWFMAFGSELHLIPLLPSPLLFAQQSFHRQWRAVLEHFLPEESFSGEVSTGAPVRTVGPQELFDQSGFQWGPRGVCRRTRKAMVSVPFPFIPHHCLAEIVKHLRRGITFHVRNTVCGSLRELTLGAPCEAGGRQPQRTPPHPHAMPSDFLLWPFTRFLCQSCKAKCTDPQSSGLWVLEAHTLHLFSRVSSFILLIFSMNVGFLTRAQMFEAQSRISDVSC